MKRLDEELVKAVKLGDKIAEDILIARYKSLVRNRARQYFLTGGETEDLIQEGMIGLFTAIRDYDASKNASFKTFSYICITRKIMSAIKNANRRKHSPLKDCPELDAETDKESNEKLPDDIIIEEEEMDELLKWLKTVLSKYEFEVLNYYLDGLSYAEISFKLNKSIKTIDNALSRAKVKIKSRLNLKTIYKSRKYGIFITL